MDSAGRQSPRGSRRSAPDPSEILASSLDLMIELRDRMTGDHCRQVGRVGEAIARQLGLDYRLVRRVGLAGRVHDLGKIAIPDRILRNSDKLSERELAIIQAHAIDGERILLSLAPLVPAMRKVAAIVVAHHERWNGAGYPRGLVGTAIPLEARVVAVADAYSALTMDRSYEPAQEHAHAVKLIKAGSGVHFDPDVVEAFLAIEQECEF
jgi:putative two-component system response regulator